MESDTPAIVTAPAPPPPVADASPRVARGTYRWLLLELVVVASGVLIALLLDGLLEWNRYRVLVAEARATIAREIEDNRREVETVMSTAEERRRRLHEAQQFSEELLRQGQSDRRELNIELEFADLTAAAWHGAQQTGALAHMDFDEVQRYSRLYDLQELYASQQRRSLETLAAATAFFGVTPDPHDAAADDLRAFRQQVLTLKAEMMIEEQLARRLSEGYQRVLAR